MMSWLKGLSSSDHRKAHRLKSPLLVAYYWDGDAPVAHEVQNISLTGFYLVTKERWRPGTIVTMVLQRTESAQANPAAREYIAVASKVVRLGKDGVGFAFIPLEERSSDTEQALKSRPAGKKAIQRFLEQLKSDQGHAIFGHIEAILKTKLSGRNPATSTPKGNVMERLKDESGQALIISALCMTCLLGFVGLATDVGIVFHEKRLLQIAADSAAIAGAAELNYANVATAARAAATQNGFTNGVSGATVAVNGPPTGPVVGPHAGNAGYVEVIVTQNQSTIFLGLFGHGVMPVTARAVATLGVGQGCVYTLGSSGTGIAWNGSGATNIPTCSILDNAGLNFTGSGNVTAQAIGVVGSYSNTGSGSLTPRPPTAIAPISDPLAFLTPPANPGSCIGGPGNLVNGSSSVTLQPGCYNGLTISGSGAVTLNPGLYYINGPFSLTGSGAVSGTNVTFYLPNSNSASFTTNGSGALTLSAPTSGVRNGILIYQDPSNTAAMSVKGSGGLNLQGVIYAPGSALTISGSGASQIYTALVTKSLTFNGSGALQDYAIKNPAPPFTAAKLVE